VSDHEEEAKIIALMKTIADAYGLWAEVKEAYDNYRAEGEEPAEACTYALYDWDLSA
jgi:hypothetical protein